MCSALEALHKRQRAMYIYLLFMLGGNSPGGSLSPVERWSKGLRLQYERITRSKHRATRSQGLNTRSHSDKLRFQNERITRSKQRATRSQGQNTRSHRDKLNLDMKGSQGLNTGRQGHKA